jgi:hypothetical protein
VRCRIPLYEIKRTAYGGADVAEFIALPACPLGPIPLAARGLAAVLARAGPAGAVVDGRPGLRTRRGERPVVGQPLTHPQDHPRHAGDEISSQEEGVAGE